MIDVESDSLLRAVAAAPPVTPPVSLVTVIATRVPHGSRVEDVCARLADMAVPAEMCAEGVVAAFLISADGERDSVVRALEIANTLRQVVRGIQIAIATDRAADPLAMPRLRDRARSMLEQCNEQTPLSLDERTSTLAADGRSAPPPSLAPAAANLVEHATMEERLINARRLFTLLVPLLAFAWLHSVFLAYTGAPEVIHVLPVMSVSLALCIARVVLLRLRPATARWLVYSVFVVEIPATFLSQYPHLTHSPDRPLVAMALLATSIAAVATVQLFMSWRVIIGVAVLMLVGTSVFFVLSGAWWYSMSATMALTCIATISIYGQSRTRALLRRVVAESETRARDAEAANEELRRQIAARSRELAGALARLASAPAHAGRFVAGDLIDERYRVLQTLGAGGMGHVYKVERITDGRHFALKVSTRAADRESLARFAREAQVAAELDHPGVVSVRDVGITASGTMFIVMELVAGQSVAQLRERYCDTAWAYGVLQQVAAVLVAMHERGVVHRDLKPANVLLDGERVKVADFGLAALTGPTPLATTVDAAADAPQLTRTGAIMGTPIYMAPELADGARAAHPAADVFSLGVMAYELLSGKLPHSVPPLLERLAGRAPPRPITLAIPGVPTELATLVHRCFSDNPTARPTASELARAFAAQPRG